MSDSLPQTPVTAPPAVPLPAAPASALLVIGGVLFILIWGGACSLMIVMSLAGVLMANDGGGASSDSHSTLIVGVLAGEGFIGLSGLPAGLAFFWRRKRRLLVAAFGALLALGIVAIALSILAFLPRGTSA